MTDDTAAYGFRAMGTEVTVLLPGCDPVDCAMYGANAAAIFAAEEQRYSRFRPDSELSRLNRAGGPFVASAELFATLQRCQHWVRATGGLFDPAVGAALVRLGYDQSFAPGALDRDEDPPGETLARGTLLDVRLDEESRTVERPPGVLIDLGGFAKGLTVDLAARALPPDSALDAGGDAFLRGHDPEGYPWLVDVEDPRDPDAVTLSFRATNAGVATSAPNRRRWRRGGATQHHLVDPRTGRAAESDLLQATVIAGCTADAEVMAKTAFLLGLTAARRWLAEAGCVGAVLVDRAGDAHVVGAIALSP